MAIHARLLRRQASDRVVVSLVADVDPADRVALVKFVLPVGRTEVVAFAEPVARRLVEVLGSAPRPGRPHPPHGFLEQCRRFLARQPRLDEDDWQGGHREGQARTVERHDLPEGVALLVVVATGRPRFFVLPALAAAYLHEQLAHDFGPAGRTGPA